eukprot:g491.t1
MGRKGKAQKHTAKEIAGKHKRAKELAGAAGGGGKGAAARKNAGQKIMILCKICKCQQPSVKSMSIHYDSKHPKENWAEVEEEYAEKSGAVKGKLLAKKKAKTHMIGALKAQATSKSATRGKELSARDKKALKEKQMAFLEASLDKKSKKAKKKTKKTKK